MNFEVTISVFIATIILLIIAFFKSRQPKEPGKPWSIPWNGVVFLCILTLMVMINHLLALNKAGAIPDL